ncbi:hypothetical protein CJ030_MR0G027290 [Morella rubra]|uniref:Uncharacterized protein n=1 Tax=Morella rubra TaxID=262757 RepID=A0A6A1UFQ4_9ROSI|nr:hypothetical protein CJ030_MR0G027290 [Morella rubra]
MTYMDGFTILWHFHLSQLGAKMTECETPRAHTHAHGSHAHVPFPSRFKFWWWFLLCMRRGVGFRTSWPLFLRQLGTGRPAHGGPRSSSNTPYYPLWVFCPLWVYVWPFGPLTRLPVTSFEGLTSPLKRVFEIATFMGIVFPGNRIPDCFSPCKEDGSSTPRSYVIQMEMTDVDKIVGVVECVVINRPIPASTTLQGLHFPLLTIQGSGFIPRLDSQQLDTIVWNRIIMYGLSTPRYDSAVTVMETGFYGFRSILSNIQTN